MPKPKVVLIAPSIKESLCFGVSDGISETMSLNFGTYPPLGICYIAGLLLKHDIAVDLIDIDGEGLSLNETVKRIIFLKPDIIGITSMSFTFIYALRLAEALKRIADIPIVIGGNHVTLYPEEVLSHNCFDIGIIGEGEQTFLEVAEAIRVNNRSRLGDRLKDIRGLIFKENGGIVQTPSRGLTEDLDELPFPAVHLLKIKNYCGCNLKKPYMTMMTSRGCPFTCYFCSKAPWAGTYRYHSAERVVSEIEWMIKSLGIKSIDFFDDTFTVDRDRIFRILDLIKIKNLHFEFGIMTRADLVNKEMLILLKDSGCKIMAIGIESGNPRILKELNKNLDLGKVSDVFDFANKIGIRTVGFFMIGNPTETIEDINTTIKFIKKLKADWFKANILIPYPGSQFYRSMLNSGELKEDYWRNFTLNPQEIPPPLANRIIDSKRLKRIRNYIDLMPYLRLRSNIFKFSKIKSLDDLKRSFCNILAFLIHFDS